MMAQTAMEGTSQEDLESIAWSAAGPSMDALLVEVALNRYNIAEIHGDGQMSTHASWCAELETPHQPDTPGAVFGRQY